MHLTNRAEPPGDWRSAAKHQPKRLKYNENSKKDLDCPVGSRDGLGGELLPMADELGSTYSQNLCPPNPSRLEFNQCLVGLF